MTLFEIPDALKHLHIFLRKARLNSSTENNIQIEWKKQPRIVVVHYEEIDQRVLKASVELGLMGAIAHPRPHDEIFSWE
ncbi:hypothetical protein ACTXT7_012164 [Hymenolepis weldensis]